MSLIQRLQDHQKIVSVSLLGTWHLKLVTLEDVRDKRMALRKKNAPFTPCVTLLRRLKGRIGAMKIVTLTD